MLLKKAAMFGLDARIALAIFGALSVISGAALYGAIKEAKVTALLVDIQELSKAFEAYYLDVGTKVPESYGTNHSSAELIKSSAVGWKGPYTSYEIDTSWNSDANYSNKQLYYPKLAESTIFFTEAISKQFLGTSGNSPMILCTNDADCAMYVGLYSDTQQAELKTYRTYLDEKIDNSDGLAKGTVKGFDHSNGGVYLYYKIMDKGNYQ